MSYFGYWWSRPNCFYFEILILDLEQVLKMLSRVCVSSRRFASGSSNFCKIAGFHEKTSETDYGKKSLFIDENTNVTYNDFNKRVGQYAALLNGKLGLTKGDRLIARTSKNIDNIALYFATLRIGAIYIPLNPGYSERETKHFVTVSIYAHQRVCIGSLLGFQAEVVGDL